MATISPERLDIVQQNWARLIEPLGVDLANAYTVFDQLIAAYSEPHRHYHNLEHVGEVFRVAGKLPAEDRTALNLAIWFHDVVYDPTQHDNELQSAERAGMWLGLLRVEVPLIHKVQALVLATAHLTRDEPPTDTDTRTLLDADLAILGSSEARYQRYAKAIRQEYAHVPEDVYRVGRAKVLRFFLTKARLYWNESLHAEGDAAARHNLQTELNQLI